MMRFSELLASAGLDAETRGDADVADVADDSRRCRPGSCFVAVRGTGDDGHRYVSAALNAGAAAVVCEDASPVPPGTPVAVVDDARPAVGRLAQAVLGWPVRKLVVVGITGTNGKSTVGFLMRDILAAAGRRAALLGTVCYQTGRRDVSAATTTPAPVALAELTAEMAAGGITHLVMEVSSHALDQHRPAGVDFNMGVFTNFSGDHLDYHGTMDRYLAAKRRLFEGLCPGCTAVLNRDEAASDAMARATGAKLVWYGLSPAADLYARIDEIDITGTRFSLARGETRAPVVTPLIGRHNVYNCLAAAAACMELGVDLDVIVAALGRVERIPGRLERVRVDVPYRVFVDYAHTDDALANVLQSLRPVTPGRIILLFGCGGDRDRTKRPRMARTAQRLADRLVVTSDNPRSEKPEAIIDEIVAGLDDEGLQRAVIEPDRRKAIALAIAQADEGDVVLVAGKGHENYQVVGEERIHFDDVEVAAEAMERRRRGR